MTKEFASHYTKTNKTCLTNYPLYLNSLPTIFRKIRHQYLSITLWMESLYHNLKTFKVRTSVAENGSKLWKSFLFMPRISWWRMEKFKTRTSSSSSNHVSLLCLVENHWPSSPHSTGKEPTTDSSAASFPDLKGRWLSDSTEVNSVEEEVLIASWMKRQNWQLSPDLLRRDCIRASFPPSREGGLKSLFMEEPSH